MRNRLTTLLAAGAVTAAAAFATTNASAMTLPAPTGFVAAIQHANPVQEAAYFCRPVWRCGYWGCGWRRACWWGPGYRYGYGHRHHRWGWGWRHRW